MTTKVKHPNDGRGFRKLKMTAMIALDPGAARVKILAAYRLADATLKGAAKHLDCTERTLHRWVDQLDMRTALDRVAKEMRPS
jgi:hypothetical protein